MHDVAISYASVDLAIAQHLASALRDVGLDVFLDRDRAEDLWGNALPATLDRIFSDCRVLLVVGSSAYGMSRWTAGELAVARRRLARTRGHADVLAVSIERHRVAGLQDTAHHDLAIDVDLATAAANVARLVCRRLAALAAPAATCAPPPETKPAMHDPHATKHHQHYNVQPNVSVQAVGGAGPLTSNVSSATRVDTRTGLGGASVVALVGLMAAVVGGAGWLLVDVVRNGPRDDDGRVHVFGIPIPSPIVSAARDEEAAPSKPELAVAAIADAATVTPLRAPPDGAPTVAELAGRWRCNHYESLTFTETRRIALSVGGHRLKDFEGSPLLELSGVPYEFVAARTMRVGEIELDVELNRERNPMTLRVIYGRVDLDCRKDAV